MSSHQLNSKNYCPFLLFMGASWSGSVIRDHPDHDASKKPINPLWKRIHRIISSRFLCPRPPLLLSAPNQNRHATQASFTMVWVISDHWSQSGSSQRNAPQGLLYTLKLLSVAMDSKDGHGLKVQKLGQFFLVSVPWCNLFDIFLPTLQEHFVYEYRH